MSANSKIVTYLSHVDGPLLDVYADFYFRFLKDSEKAPANLQQFLELRNEVTTDKASPVKQYFTNAEYEENVNKVKPIMDRLLFNLVQENNVPEVFYSNLWKNINNPAFFRTDIEKVSALLLVATSAVIPYFQMGEAMRMDDEEFKQTASEVYPYFQKARFALNRGYEQRTEIASQLISILKELDGEKRQIIYVAQLLAYFERKLRKKDETIERLKSSKQGSEAQAQPE